MSVFFNCTETRCKFGRRKMPSTNKGCSKSTIENVWQILKNEVKKKSPKYVPELREKIQESQHILTSEMRYNLMNSVSVRLNEVISSKGKHIRL